MLQAFVITLREGLEAFLIIAISLAYLRKSGRRELIPAVHWGIGLSVLLSVGAAYLFQQASNQALWEGILAIVAAVSVATLTVHMWRTAKKIKSEIEGHLRESTGEDRHRGLGWRVPVHAADDFARGHGDRAADGHAADAGAGDVDSRRRHCRHARGRRRRDAVVALRPSRQPRAVLPGHRDFPDGVCRAAADLRLPRVDRGQPVPRQRGVALGHRAVRAGRHLRSIPDLHARRGAPRVAAVGDVDRLEPRRALAAPAVPPWQSAA